MRFGLDRTVLDILTQNDRTYPEMRRSSLSSLLKHSQIFCLYLPQKLSVGFKMRKMRNQALNNRRNIA